MPMMNVINGGAHADNSIDLQEFMVVPAGASSFAEAMRIGTEVYHSLKACSTSAGLSTAVGDEGGFAPDLASSEEAIEAILEAAERAGPPRARRDRARPGRRPSSSTTASTASRAARRTARQWPTSTPASPTRYPLVSVEDGLAEDDWDAWQALTERLGDRVQLVGDDLFVTNVERLARGIDEGVANAILIKVNQIGTLTETLDAIGLARSDGYSRGHLAPLGRDRGHDDRRPRGGDRRGPDQDGRAVPHRPRGEVQPAAADRGGARPARRVPGLGRLPLQAQLGGGRSAPSCDSDAVVLPGGADPHGDETAGRDTRERVLTRLAGTDEERSAERPDFIGRALQRLERQSSPSRSSRSEPRSTS